MLVLVFQLRSQSHKRATDTFGMWPQFNQKLIPCHLPCKLYTCAIIPKFSNVTSLLKSLNSVKVQTGNDFAFFFPQSLTTPTLCSPTVSQHPTDIPKSPTHSQAVKAPVELSAAQPCSITPASHLSDVRPPLATSLWV